MIRVNVITLALLISNSGCLSAAVSPSQSKISKEPAVSARWLMGTRCEIRVYPNSGWNQRAVDSALDRIRELEDVMTTWRADGELFAVNQRLAGPSATDAPLPLSQDLTAALATARSWAERTEGRFDPTLGALIESWGIHASPARPTASRLAHAKEKTGWRDYSVNSTDRNLSVQRAGLQFDLGGIGKGIALDEAAQILRDRGITSGILDFGGQILALGPPPGDAGWIIEIADPRDREQSLTSVLLDTGSLATSDNSQQLSRPGKEFVGHLLDPHSGLAVSAASSVTVFAPTATAADALSTALLVSKPPERRALLPVGASALTVEWTGTSPPRLELLGPFPGSFASPFATQWILENDDDG